MLEHPSGAHDVVQFGDTIILTDLASGKAQRVQLVSKVEAAGAIGTLVQISPDSPVGAQLEGRQVGETIRVVLKQREVQYRITEIEPYGD
ncbi:GreA/GreB family elongation factor [Deinococcus gobiensis]|uniref:GreA/GreB family elongation factor n=1 Tax=Deinococcus gobiensis TaxID=502394 RepID=UPI0002DD100E|nr:GreA/GreB family elongation factor [Deinococcus gobiensis]